MTDDLPTISLVTPSFNQAEYIEETLSSVVSQAYPGLEYVVIDAASTDGSQAVIERYADGIATWVSEPDKGHTDGLNKGFSRAHGDVMGWINSSDILLPWALRTIGEVFRDLPEVQWITGLSTLLGLTGGPRAVYATEWNRYDFLAGNYRWLQQESVFWRRGLWERAGGRIDPSVEYACDFSLWLRFMELAPLHHVQVPLGAFRRHEDRRGTARAGAYERETRRLWTAWAAAAPVAERRRARLAGAVGGRGGRVWRAALSAGGCAPWYRHPRIEFDFDANRWTVTR
jgi:glycosyltransferase involved in cell wall biosynthesis